MCPDRKIYTPYNEDPLEMENIMTKNQYPTAKSIVRFVVGYSTSFATSRAIVNMVAPTTPLEKGATVVAAVLGGFYVGSKAEGLSDTYFDRSVEWLQSR